MKKDIAPEVLAFLKRLPSMPCATGYQDTFTKEDEARIKVMLSNATDRQAHADREALKQYILNQDFKDTVEIADADRQRMAEYLQKNAPEFYKLLLKTTF